MLKVVRTAALLLLATTQTSAYAASCEGQKGKVIFEDDFADDSGGWPAYRGAGADAKFGKSGLALHIQDPTKSWALQNQTFAAAEGDFCMEAVLPKADMNIRTGLIFLRNDTDNMYALDIDSNNAIQLWRKEGGSWVKLSDMSDEKVKPEPESVIALRVVAKANLITASVNGVEMKKLRAQLPGGNPKFGYSVETDKPVPAPGVTFQFKRYKVTAGE
jgi:hypothetical protein